MDTVDLLYPDVSMRTASRSPSVDQVNVSGIPVTAAASSDSSKGPVPEERSKSPEESVENPSAMETDEPGGSKDPATDPLAEAPGDIGSEVELPASQPLEDPAFENVSEEEPRAEEAEEEAEREKEPSRSKNQAII